MPGSKGDAVYPRPRRSKPIQADGQRMKRLLQSGRIPALPATERKQRCQAFGRCAMTNVAYADRLIRITDDAILFRCYYFPWGSKRVELSAIDHVEVLQPTLLNGKWRIHGTGDFRTWFPRDVKRPRRDLIFILNLHRKRRRIGFTVEDSNAVKKFFADKNMITGG